MPELVDAARRHARDNPDAPLIDAPAERRVLTARQLQADATATAADLRRLGIGPGHAVAAHVGNHSGYFSLLLACLDVGAAILPIDGSAPAAEAEAVAARFDAVAMVVPDGRGGAGEHGLQRDGLGVRRRQEREALAAAQQHDVARARVHDLVAHPAPELSHQHRVH